MAKRQAKENKWALTNELNKLFVHGFLHIFGHNHELPKDYKKMYKIECEVLGQKSSVIKSKKIRNLVI